MKLTKSLIFVSGGVTFCALVTIARLYCDILSKQPQPVMGKPEAKGTSFRAARGVIPWKEGDEKPEDTISRLRDHSSGCPDYEGPQPWDPDYIGGAVMQVSDEPFQNEHLSDILRKVLEWCNAYPEDVFIPCTKEDWDRFHQVLKDNGLNGTAFTGDISRHIVNGIKRIIATGK